MQIRKFVASSLAALMAGATFAGAALAAVNVGGVLSYLGQQAAEGVPYLVVVGDNAAVTDVIGAIDVASALAQQVTKEVSLPGVTVFDVEGRYSNDIEFEESITDVFGSTLTKTHIPYLVRDKLEIDGTTYYVEEKVLLPTTFKVNIDPVKYNGTLYLGSLEGLGYVYEFKGGLNLTAAGVNYERPLEVKILGKPYYVVGTATNGIRVMSGVFGEADATTPLEYKNYKIYVIDGVTGGWAKVQVRDANDRVLRTTIVNVQQTRTFSDLKLKVRVVNVWASSITNTVTAQLLVGEEVDKTITDDSEFEENKNWKWNIDVNGDVINSVGLVYSPSEEDARFIKIGEKLVAPNDYFEVGYPKNVVDQYVTLTVKVAGPTYVYTDVAKGTRFQTTDGVLLIEASSPIFRGESSSKLLIYYNTTGQKWALAYYDEIEEKFVDAEVITPPKTISASFDKTPISIWFHPGSSDYTLNITVQANAVKANYTILNNKVVSLGVKKGEAEEGELNVFGTNRGTFEYTITSQYGVVVESPKTHGAADRVVLRIPAEQQKAYVYVGKLKGEVRAEGGTYKTIVPLALPVARLASEVTDLDKRNANIVLVGGPCVNALVEELVSSGKLEPEFTCKPTLGSAWAEKTAYVRVIEDAFSRGRIALLIAGTKKEDTRLATDYLSKGLLADRKESGVKLVGDVRKLEITPI